MKMTILAGLMMMASWLPAHAAEGAATGSGPVTYQSLVDMLTSLDSRPLVRSKVDPEYDDAVDKWQARLQTDHLEEEWHRLHKERSQFEAAQSSDLIKRRHVLLTSLFFETAVQHKNTAVIELALMDGPVGFMAGFKMPEFYLVRELGPPAFGHIFTAYAKATSPEVKTWLAKVTRSSFGPLKDKVWLESDSDDAVMTKLGAWFKLHLPELRTVEVYRPMSSRQWYFEQGMQDNEKLIGVFFWRSR